MLRTILSVIAATLVGTFVIALIETLGHEIVPQPEGIDPTDAESIKAHMDEIPILSFVMIWLASIVGAFTAGAISAILVRENQKIAAVSCGILLMLYGSIMIYMIPHPLWFSIGTLLTYIPLALVGSKFGSKIKENNVI